MVRDRLARGARDAAVRGLRPAVCVLLAASLAACATSAPRPAVRQAATQSVFAVPAAQDLPLKLIGAEFAVQRGDLATAAGLYVEACLLSADPSIAEQATRVSLAVKRWDLAAQAVARWQAIAPEAGGILQAQAWIALARGDVDKAFADLERIARRSQENGWRPVGQVLAGADDKAAAAGLLARLATPERLGDREAVWIAMSQLALKLGDTPLAERLSADALRRFGGGDAYAWSAQLALDRGDKTLARDRYAEALRREPASLRLRTGYAALLSDSGDNRAAARALSGGEQTDVTFGARAAYAARAEDKALLGTLYREIEADAAERSGRRLFLLGQIAELIGEPAEALDWYREVPEDDERWFDAGRRYVVLADEAGDSAASSARLADMRVVAGIDAEESGNLVLLEAELLTRKKRKAEALAVYSRGLEQLPDDGRLLYSRAMLAIDLGDLPAAERDLRRMIELDPQSADALNALGYTLADRTDRLDEAAALVARALEIKPDEPAIIDSYGWVQYRRGNLAEARTHLEKAYAAHPDGEIAAHLGEVLWASGDREAARRIWAEALVREPGHAVLAETKKRLDP